MKHDLYDDLPDESLVSWTPEELDYIHDADYWARTIVECDGARIVSIGELETNEEAWLYWIGLDNEYAVKDRGSVGAGACRYLNFVRFVL